MRTLKTLALAAFAAGAVALPLAAQAEGYTSNSTTTQSGQSGASASTNMGAEGNISSKQFSALDSDRSGSLTESEFSQHTSASIDFGRADANGDGALTLSELNNAQVNSKR